MFLLLMSGIQNYLEGSYIEHVNEQAQFLYSIHVEVSDDLGTKAIEEKMEIAFNTWLIILSF